MPFKLSLSTTTRHDTIGQRPNHNVKQVREKLTTPLTKSGKGRTRTLQSTEDKDNTREKKYTKRSTGLVCVF